MFKFKDKEKILKAAKEKLLHTREPQKDFQQIFQVKL